MLRVLQVKRQECWFFLVFLLPVIHTRAETPCFINGKTMKALSGELEG